MDQGLISTIAIIIFIFAALRFVMYFIAEGGLRPARVTPSNEVINRATEMYNADMYAELERYLKVELQKRPKNVKLLKIFVNTLLKRDKVAHAVTQLERLTKLMPNDMEVKAKLAECYADIKRTKQAIILNEEVFRHDPNNPGIAKSLAELYYASKQQRQALTQYETYVKLEKDVEKIKKIQPELAKLYLDLGEFEKALSLYDSIQEERPDDKEILKIRIELSQKLQMWEKCLQASKKLLVVKGETNELNEKIAQMLFNLSQWDEALEYYKKLTRTENEENSNFLHCQNRIAEIYINKGDTGKAIDILSKLIEKYPAEDSLAYTLAQAHVASSNYEKAIHLYENLLHSLPTEQSDMLKRHTSNLVVMWAESLFKQGDYTKAFDKYIQAIKYNDENPEVYYKFGVSNLKIKSLNDAMAHFKRAITLNPEEPRYHYALGCANDEIGNLKAAKSSFEDAFVRDRENSKYMSALAIAMAKQYANLETSIELFKNVIVKSPNDADALYNLALAYDMLESRDEAIKYYKRAVQVMPNHTEARHNLSILLGYEFNPAEEQLLN